MSLQSKALYVVPFWSGRAASWRVMLPIVQPWIRQSVFHTKLSGKLQTSENSTMYLFVSPWPEDADSA